MSLTLFIIIITCLISYQAFNDRMLKVKLIFLPAKIKETGEWYRFFSSGLIHADWMHLFFNMYVLYAFGNNVEFLYSSYFGAVTGKVLYLMMYVLGIGAASIPDYYKHHDYYGYAALGASGAVSGVLFSIIFFMPWTGGIGILFLPGSIPPALFGVLYLWYSSYMSKRNADNIGHSAHFWGAVFGFTFTFIAALIIRPSLVQQFFSEFVQGLLISNWM